MEIKARLSQKREEMAEVENENDKLAMQLLKNFETFSYELESTSQHSIPAAVKLVQSYLVQGDSNEMRVEAVLNVLCDLLPLLESTLYLKNPLVQGNHSIVEKLSKLNLENMEMEKETKLTEQEMLKSQEQQQLLIKFSEKANKIGNSLSQLKERPMPDWIDEEKMHSAEMTDFLEDQVRKSYESLTSETLELVLIKDIDEENLLNFNTDSSGGSIVMENGCIKSLTIDKFLELVAHGSEWPHCTMFLSSFSLIFYA